MAAKIKNPKNLWLFCRVVEALILIVAGLLAIIYYSNSTLQKVIFYLIGAFLCVDALIRVARFVIDPSKISVRGKGLLVSAIEIALGLIFFIKPEFLPSLIKELIPLFIGVLLFAIAAICIMEGLIRIISKSKKVWIWIVEFIVAAVFIAFGVMLIYYQYNDPSTSIINIMFIVLGVIFIIWGLLVLINGFKPLDKTFDKIADTNSNKPRN